MVIVKFFYIIYITVLLIIFKSEYFDKNLLRLINISQFKVYRLDFSKSII